MLYDSTSSIPTTPFSIKIRCVSERRQQLKLRKASGVTNVNPVTKTLFKKV